MRRVDRLEWVSTPLMVDDKLRLNPIWLFFDEVLGTSRVRYFERYASAGLKQGQGYVREHFSKKWDMVSFKGKA